MTLSNSLYRSQHGFTRPLGVVLACALVTFAAPAWAQTPQGTVAPSNVVQLSARGFKEVPQDWLRMNLSTNREGADAATVQSQLRQAVDAALALARPAAQPQAMEVRTCGFSLQPRYTNNGKMSGWQGSAELVLEGRDFARISSTAGRIQTLTVSSVGFSLSREAQQALETEVQAMAIERFKQRAGEVAKAFGFSTYSLQQIAISSADHGGGPVQPVYMTRQATAAMADESVPVEAGKSVVSVNVSGSVQLR